MTEGRVRLRFWIEAGAALISGCLFLVTLFWRNWIELVFGMDPDAGSGSLEWSIVLVAAILTVALVTLARQEWRSRVVTA